MAKPKITPYQGKQMSLLDHLQEPLPVPRKLSSQWVSSSVVCGVLGFSSKHLARLMEDGTLKQGKHWRNISPTAARPTYRYHLKRCEAALESQEDAIEGQIQDLWTQLTVDQRKQLLGQLQLLIGDGPIGIVYDSDEQADYLDNEPNDFGIGARG